MGLGVYPRWLILLGPRLLGVVGEEGWMLSPGRYGVFLKWSSWVGFSYTV